MKIGIERLDIVGSLLKGKSISLICNESSADKNLKHSLDILSELGINIKSVMGPQHGFFIDKQDNMKESDHTNWRGLPVYSLYGAKREPEDYMLEDVDSVVFDLQDVGSRYYTFIYTMAYAMKACAKLGKEFIVLDRPNPINGVDVEGGVIHKGYESFVGLYPISNRHGMTVAELARMFNEEFAIACDLKVVEMESWSVEKYWDELDGRSWLMPSPNMPLVETAVVYPGQCLLEATNISEGRGSTRPFEIFGAPFIDHDSFLLHPIIKSLEGIYLRPLHFSPSFNKFSSELCKGFQIHVLDRKVFKPLKTTLSFIYILKELYPKDFFFLPPPYEYEFNKMPIDILLGTEKPRCFLDKGVDFVEYYNFSKQGEKAFLELRSKYLIYPR